MMPYPSGSICYQLLKDQLIMNVPTAKSRAKTGWEVNLSFLLRMYLNQVYCEITIQLQNCMTKYLPV